MRELETIYQELLTAFAQRAGFVPEEGCDLSVRLYASAAQLQALEIQADWVLDQSFPQTAQGIYLDRHAAMRGISRIAAVPASGTLRFFVETASAVDLKIPAGTICMNAKETRFQTTAEGTLPAGELFVDVPASAVEAGKSSNAPAGSVTILTACPVGITRCANPKAFVGGSDAEDDAALRMRVLESYRRLPNGANAAWYERTAMNHASVAAARAVGRARGIGTVDVYVTTDAGIPSAELVRAVGQDLQEKREIAVDVKALAPTASAVNLSVSVLPRTGTSFAAVREAVEHVITSFFNGRLLGKPIRLAELGNLIYSVDGVDNYQILTPKTDLAADDKILPVLGTLEVTEMGA